MRVSFLLVALFLFLITVGLSNHAEADIVTKNSNCRKLNESEDQNNNPSSLDLSTILKPEKVITEKEDAILLAQQASAEERAKTIADHVGQPSLPIKTDYVFQQLKVIKEEGKGNEIEEEEEEEDVKPKNYTPEEIDRLLSPIPQRVPTNEEDKRIEEEIKQKVKNMHSVPESQDPDDFHEGVTDDVDPQKVYEPKVEPVTRGEVEVEEEIKEKKKVETPFPRPQISSILVKKQTIEIHVDVKFESFESYCALFGHDSPRAQIHQRKFKNGRAIFPWVANAKYAQCFFYPVAIIGFVETDRIRIPDPSNTSFFKVLIELCGVGILLVGAFVLVQYLRNRGYDSNEIELAQRLLQDRESRLSISDNGEESSLSFIDDLVNISKKKKPKYVGLVNYRLCPYCGNKNKRNEKVCIYCNGSFNSFVCLRKLAIPQVRNSRESLNKLNNKRILKYFFKFVDYSLNMYSDGQKYTSDEMEQNYSFSINNSFIVFDWDDTIICTSSFEKSKMDLPSFRDVYSHYIQKCEETAYNLLDIAIQSGTVYIVTNASSNWIYYSCSILMPKLLTLLSCVGIISCRDSLSERYPNKEELWKSIVFNNLFYEKDLNCPTSVLSIGDSINERNALLSVADNNKYVIPKSIKLMERPSIPVLYKQQEFIYNNLSTFVFTKTHVDNKLSFMN